MKKIALTLFIIAGMAVHTIAATIITIKAQSGKIIIDSPLSVYQLPVTLRFSSDVLQSKRKITFYDQTTNQQVLPNILVANIPHPNGFYDLNVAADGKLALCNSASGNCTLKASFIIKIDGVPVTTPIMLDDGVPAAPQATTAVATA